MITLPRLIERKPKRLVKSGIIFIVPDKPYKMTICGEEEESISHIPGKELTIERMKRIIALYLNPMTTNSRILISESTEEDLTHYEEYIKKVKSLRGIQ